MAPFGLGPIFKELMDDAHCSLLGSNSSDIGNDRLRNQDHLGEVDVLSRAIGRLIANSTTMPKANLLPYTADEIVQNNFETERIQTTPSPFPLIPVRDLDIQKEQGVVKSELLEPGYTLLTPIKLISHQPETTTDRRFQLESREVLQLSPTSITMMVQQATSLNKTMTVNDKEYTSESTTGLSERPVNETRSGRWCNRTVVTADEVRRRQLERNAARIRAKRAAETPEQRRVRRENEARYRRELRATETEEKRRRRLQRDSARQRANRAARSKRRREGTDNSGSASTEASLSSPSEMLNLKVEFNNDVDAIDDTVNRVIIKNEPELNYSAVNDYLQLTSSGDVDIHNDRVISLPSSEFVDQFVRFLDWTHTGERLEYRQE